MPFLRKYNTATTISGIPLITKSAVDFKANPTLAAGDVKISLDDGAFNNLATLPTVTPTSDTSVKVALSAAELQCARAVIRFMDQTSPKEWEDQEIIIETFGNASATIAFDLSAATATVGGYSTGQDPGTLVWESDNKTLTSFGTLIPDIVEAVWNYVKRTVTGGRLWGR